MRRIFAASLLLACAHERYREPDLMIARGFEPVGDPCENRQLAGVPVSPECIIASDVDLQTILDDPSCRVPLPAQDGFYCTRPRLLVDAGSARIVVAPGATAIVHVTLTPAGDAAVLVDFDPGAQLEVQSSTPPLSHACVLWSRDGSSPTPSRDRARVLLRPHAVIHARIPWHATWTDADDHCNPIQRRLPRGLYTLAVPNPAYPEEMQRVDWEYGLPPTVTPREIVGEVR